MDEDRVVRMPAPGSFEPDTKTRMESTVSRADREQERREQEAYSQGYDDGKAGRPHRLKWARG